MTKQLRIKSKYIIIAYIHELILLTSFQYKQLWKTF